MVIHTTLSEVSATAGTVPDYPDDIGAINLAAGQSATEDLVNNVYTRYTYSYVNAAGEALAPGAAASNYVRYCEYPGERLFTRVKFDVNGNPLDEYTIDAMMFYQKFRVAPGKETGWKRLMGQEIPLDAVSDVCSVAGASPYPAAVSNLTYNGTAVPAAAAPSNSLETNRKLGKILNGPQTPKATQPQLDLWIPLLFWFNRDSRLSVASVSIPYGQRFITVYINQQSNLVFTAPGNLFLRLVTESWNNSDGTAAGTGALNYHRYQTQTPVLLSNSSVSSSQSIPGMELYINNIFVNPEIHDIYIKRIGFSLIRVHRYQSNRVNTNQNELLMSQLKWPVETLFVGLRPTWNIDSANPNQPRDWHRLTALTDNACVGNAQVGSAVVGNPAAALGATTTWLAAWYQPTMSYAQTERLTYTTAQKTIQNLKVLAHGIPIYDDYNSEFFNVYTPWQYGGYQIVCPEDEGALMVNFCLYPGTYQPSGHLNVSRAREFYLRYTAPNSTVVSAANPADLLTLAICLNFLLISDGSAVLRYST